MQVLNLYDLPEFTRRELLDFYQFLQQKYALPQDEAVKQESAPLAPRLVEPFEPINRDELYERFRNPFNS